jgi:hypothetical protein
VEATTMRKGPKRPRILAGESYLDRGSGEVVVVVEEVLDRSGPSPRRTGRFRVASAARGGCLGAMVVEGAALGPCLMGETPADPLLAARLADALAEVGRAALPGCRDEGARRVALALSAGREWSDGDLAKLSGLLGLRTLGRSSP